MIVPEQYRVKNGPFATTAEDGCVGAFRIPHPHIRDYEFICIAADGKEYVNWEHVSISLRQKRGAQVKRCPTWEEMCFIKDLFWEEDVPVMQLHPAKAQHVNVHPYCLHLWRPVEGEIPMPPSVAVG